MNYPIFQALDETFIRRFFQKNFQSYFLARESIIRDVKIHKISPEWAKDACRVRYEVLRQDGKREFLRGTSHRRKSNRSAWKIMNYLYKSGFDKGNLVIPHPLDFIAKINMVLYKEAKGEPFSIIVERGCYREIEKYLKQISKWLIKLHTNPFFKLPVAQLNYSGDCLTIFKKLWKIIPEVKRDLNFTYRQYISVKPNDKNITLIHNDFYPGNIIIKGNKVTVIDFDKAGLGSPMMDLATIFVSLDFPSAIWLKNITIEKISALQKVFLNEYAARQGWNIETCGKALRPHIVRVLLDQIYHHAVYIAGGWSFMDQIEKESWKNKIISLINRFKSSLILNEDFIRRF